MCRIFGYLSAESNHFSSRISDVLKVQIHGGPDAQNVLATQQYGIGSNRLAITDPEGGSQPYNNIPGIYAVLNGEIYNHADLRTELTKDGFKFSDRCDGTIIPAMYVKYGRNFAEYLDGMFSIALLDLRAQKPKFTLVSDTSGIKPTYFSYVPSNSSFVFATEVPAILRFGVATGDIWEAGMDYYLTARTVTGGRTLLKNVHSLPPGSILEATLGSEPEISSYKSRITYDGPVPSTLEEASEIFRGLLEEEVGKLSYADAKVCSINSGGLDSSLLTALLNYEKPKTASFHVACKGNWPFDERRYAKELAESYGIEHQEVMINPGEIPDIIPHMVYHLGLPNCAPHALSAYKLFQGVSDKGYRVAITGEGSDELFCGHDRMRQAIHDGEENWITSYIDSISPCREKTRHRLYNCDYKTFLQEKDLIAMDDIRSFILSVDGNRSAAIRRFEQKHSLVYYILHRVEPLAMASAVEVRVPYCQPRIMDYAWKLDSSLFLQNGDRGKAIVYGAAKRLVPDSILGRPKQPFTLPVIALMHEGSFLMDYARDMILSNKMFATGMFDRNGLEDLFRRQTVSPEKETAFTIWALLIYAVWEEMIKDIVKTANWRGLDGKQPVYVRKAA